MNKKTVIYFRANGSLSIGYGHVIRSLALAEILKKKFDCRFIIQEPDGFLKKEILKICKNLIELPVFSSLSEEATYIAKNICNPKDFMVLDGYKFSSHYQKIIKPACSKLICIDDPYKEHFLADVIINHGEGIAEAKYKKEWYSKVYTGSKYAILRKPFYKQKESSVKNKINNYNVFINLGGTDPNNYTLKALKKVVQIREVTAINIVVGELFPFKEEVLAVMNVYKNIDSKLHVNLDAEKMASLMKKSSIGICAASSVSYEYASVGGLMFVYKTADNQKNIYSFLIKEKIAFPVNKLQDNMNCIRSYRLLEKYFQKKKLFFSGNSPDNLLQIFTRLLLDTKISVRRANSKDLMTYYHWANEKTVRKNSIHKEPIPLESHKLWFKSRLSSENAFLYFFQLGNRKIGQVRIEIVNANHAEIDFSIDKELRGKGYSEIILRKAIFMFKSEYKKAIRLKGLVKTENIPSWKAFVNNGFANKGIVEIGKESYYKFLLK